MTELVIKGHNNSLSYPLQVTVDINNTILEYLPDSMDFRYKFDCDSSQLMHYQIKISVSGKQQQLEKISLDNVDQHEDIISAAFVIDQITIDGFDVMPILNNTARYNYHHPNNNEKIQEFFTTHLGYDGYQQFELVTPIWAWFIIDNEF
jgi:hypothetical protein